MRAKDSLDYLQEGVDNVLSYYVIKEGVIDHFVAHYVTLDNDGNPVFSLDGFVDGECLLSVEKSVTVLSEGDSAMLVRYYNEEGEVVYGRFAR